MQLEHYCEYKIATISDFGETANSHRKKINLTYEKLCEFTNISRDTASRFLNGDENTSLSNVMKMLNILDLEVTLKSRLPSAEIKTYISDRKVR
jgi:transcriptional regulator with XRE-family HTH domain